MARKKRLPEVKNAPLTTATPQQPKEKIVYEDAFQHAASQRILDASRKIEGKGKTIIYALGAILALGILAALFYAWNNRATAAAQTALGKAVEISQAPVTQQPLPPTFTGKAFKTEKERSEAAIAEFQKVADAHGGEIAAKAKYFIAVNKLSIDRNAALAELENLKNSGGETASLAKFALAQAKQGEGKFDEALAFYNELAQSKEAVISKDTINFEIASIYEKQGKTAEAVNLYYTIAKAASELKDFEGKSIPLAGSARAAKNKLDELDPAKAAEIKEEIPQLPIGM